jgi:hypothetical protein
MNSDTNKTNNKGLAIIEKLLTQENKDIAKKYRKLDGYPEGGFFNKEAYDKFSKKKRKGLFGYFVNFFDEILDKNPGLKNEIDNPEFFFVLFDLYRFSYVTSKNKDILNDTGCSWILVSKKEEAEKLKNGVYLRISPDSKIEHIKKFLERKINRDVFNHLTGITRLNLGMESRSTKIVKSSTTDRDLEIIKLSKKSAGDLSLLSGLDKRLKRDEHISKMMKRQYPNINPGLIRKIISLKKHTVTEL